MKTKLSKIIILLIILISIPSVIVFGKSDDFVPSVKARNKVRLANETSNEDGVSIREIVIEHDGKRCWAKLVLTPWPKKSTLSKAKEDDMDAAYKSIEDANSIGDLNPGIEEYAIRANTTVDDLVVRDIFDLSVYSSQNFETEHKPEYDDLFNIQLTTEQLQDFVCLLHYMNGEWKVVAGVKITGENKDILSFHASSLSPFAIVVKNRDVYRPVNTATK